MDDQIHFFIEYPETLSLDFKASTMNFTELPPKIFEKVTGLLDDNVCEVAFAPRLWKNIDRNILTLDTDMDTSPCCKFPECPNRAEL